MENKKINVAKLLKNCPKGMELDCAMFEDVELDCVIDGDKYPIKIIVKDDAMGDITIPLTKEGYYTIAHNPKCIIFPRGKASWEGFVPPVEFKNGDVVCTTLNGIAIIKEESGAYYTVYCGANDDVFYLYADVTPMRLATEEERQKLFDAIKKNGYKWDAERKCLIELPKFKNGDILAAGDWVFIFKELHTNGSPRCYCHYDLTLEEFKVDTNSYMAYGGDICLATKEQQDLLFSKMKGAGYKWNAETKTLKKLIEPKFKVGDRLRHKEIEKGTVFEISEVRDSFYTVVDSSWIINMEFQDLYEPIPDKFDTSSLKPFDKVLVRKSKDGDWACDFFSHLRHEDSLLNKFRCIGVGYKYCIPYAGNEHLCGTSDDCAEFYKNWED